MSVGPEYFRNWRQFHFLQVFKRLNSIERGNHISLFLWIDFFVQTSFSLNQQDLFCMNPNLGWYVGKSCAKVKQIFPRSIWQRGEQPSRNICLSVDDTFFFAIHRAHLKSVCKRNWYLLNPDSSQVRGKLCTSKTNLFDQINLSWSQILDTNINQSSSLFGEYSIFRKMCISVIKCKGDPHDLFKHHNWKISA